MKITKKWLEEQEACKDAVDFFCKQHKTQDMEILQQLIKENRLDWANWLIVRIMTYKQYVSYAIYAAEQVIEIYEKKYPNDDRPRKDIEDAIKISQGEVVDGAGASYAAVDYASTPEAASPGAGAAANAAYFAVRTAITNDATNAAYATHFNNAGCVAHINNAGAAAYTAHVAIDAAYFDNPKTQLRIEILRYGFKLLGFEWGENSK